MLRWNSLFFRVSESCWSLYLTGRRANIKYSRRAFNTFLTFQRGIKCWVSLIIRLRWVGHWLRHLSKSKFTPGHSCGFILTRLGNIDWEVNPTNSTTLNPICVPQTVYKVVFYGGGNAPCDHLCHKLCAINMHQSSPERDSQSWPCEYWRVQQ